MANTSTPTSTKIHSMGDLTMHVVEFTNITTASTWASGIPNVLAWWARSYAGTATGEAALVMSVSHSVSSTTGGTFTFNPVANATSGTLFALSGGNG